MTHQDPYDQSVQAQLDGLQRRLAILSAEVAYLPMDVPEQRALHSLADVVSRQQELVETVVAFLASRRVSDAET